MSTFVRFKDLQRWVETNSHLGEDSFVTICVPGVSENLDVSSLEVGLEGMCEDGYRHSVEGGPDALDRARDANADLQVDTVLRIITEPAP